MVRCVVLRCGVVWCGVVWCGVVWCGVVWCGVVWCGVVWCGVVWCGVVWCGVVWCGVVWCGVVWCGVVWCRVMYRHVRCNRCMLVDCSETKNIIRPVGYFVPLVYFNQTVLHVVRQSFSKSINCTVRLMVILSVSQGNNGVMLSQ